MSTKIRRYPLGNLSLGMVVDQNPLETIPGGCVVGTSNVVWVDGWLRARPGLLSVYALPVIERVHHLTVHQTLAGVRNLCAITMNISTGVGTLWYYVAGTWNNVGTIPSPELSLTIPPTSCNWGGVTYFTTGNGPIYYFDPADATPFGTLNSLQPDPLFTAADKVHILVAGDARLIAGNLTRTAVDLPYRLEWSDFAVPTTWQGALGNKGGTSGGTVLPKNSDAVTGLYVDSSVLTIFRPREVYLGVEVGAPAEFTVRCFIQGPGCVAHATIQPYRDGQIVWLGDDNVYLGAPGQKPTPIGDHIRLRIREISNLGLLGQTKALLDYDHQLYTLFLPDVQTGLCTRMFTCNLRNMGWWEGKIADPSMAVTDAIAYRINPWQTQNLVGTTDGRVLQYILGYTQDDQTKFPCSWVSTVLTSKQFFGLEHEQASVQSLRVIGQLAATSPTEQVNLSVLHGDGIDHMATRDFAPPQVLDGVSPLFSFERVTGENTQVIAQCDDASLFPLVAQIELGAIAQGPTR